jgi:Phage integrase central domain/Arm DNA-binding domain
MATINKLTALGVTKAARRGYLNDGGGLYLRIALGGAKSWVFRFKVDGRLREMGLGSVATFTLAEARERARECRKLRAAGRIPFRNAGAGALKAKLDAAKAMTFKQCAERYIDAQKASWKNDKHAAQWPATLAAYVYPVFGALPVQAVDVGLITKALEPIWTKKPETAGRVRGRIESVLDWATTRGYR